MHKFLTHKRLTSVGVVAVLALAGAASAYWTPTAGSSRRANVGTGRAATLTATVPESITPGSSEPVSFTAANAIDTKIYVATVHLVSVTPDVVHSGCTTADFSMPDVREGVELAAGATAQPLPSRGTLVYTDTAVNQDACKGATLTLTLTSS